MNLFDLILAIVILFLGSQIPEIIKFVVRTIYKFIKDNTIRLVEKSRENPPIYLEPENGIRAKYGHHLFNIESLEILIIEIENNQHTNFYGYFYEYFIKKNTNLAKALLINLLKKKKIDLKNKYHFSSFNFKSLIQKHREDIDIICEYLKISEITFRDIHRKFHSENKLIDTYINFNGNLEGIPLYLLNQEQLSKCMEVNKSLNNHYLYFIFSKKISSNFLNDFINSFFNSKLNKIERLDLLASISNKLNTNVIYAIAFLQEFPETRFFLRQKLLNDEEIQLLIKRNSEITTKDFYESYDLESPSHEKKYTFNEASQSIEKYKGLKEGIRLIKIPKYFGERKVLELGDYSFHFRNYTSNKNSSKYNDLLYIDIPNSINTILEHAFSNNKLTKVHIPNSVTYIGNSAFSNNLILDIEIPDSVTYIGSHAFSGNNIKEIIIPKSLTEISDYAFSNIGFEKRTVDINLLNMEYELLEKISFHDSIKKIGDHAFSGNQIKNIVIPDSVIHIGDDAFYKNQLESVIIGENVEYIGNRAFSSQNLKLKRVIILGDQKRFNDRWTKIGFPLKSKP